MFNSLCLSHQRQFCTLNFSSLSVSIFNTSTDKHFFFCLCPEKCQSDNTFDELVHRVSCKWQGYKPQPKWKSEKSFLATWLQWCSFHTWCSVHSHQLLKCLNCNINHHIMRALIITDNIQNSSDPQYVTWHAALIISTLNHP